MPKKRKYAKTVNEFQNFFLQIWQIFFSACWQHCKQQCLNNLSLSLRYNCLVHPMFVVRFLMTLLFD